MEQKLFERVQILHTNKFESGPRTSIIPVPSSSICPEWVAMDFSITIDANAFLVWDSKTNTDTSYQMIKKRKLRQIGLRRRKLDNLKTN